MARTINKLTDADCRGAPPLGKMAKPLLMVGDGDGLWLQYRPKVVNENQPPEWSRSWLFRYRVGSKQRCMGLGGYPTIGLAEARRKAKVLREGLTADPMAARVDLLAVKQARALQAAATAKEAITFKAAAQRYIKAHEGTWKNPKHAAQWPATMERYVYPVFGDLAVAAVSTALVLKAIERIWNDKPETAGRVRGRVEAVLDWATARGYRKGDNPARWRGHLDKLLPAKSKVKRVRPQPALPYERAGAFIAELRQRRGMGARALELAILTAARSGEIVGTRWSEIDFKTKLWTVPEDRMKANKEHRIPLSEAAMAILRPLFEARLSDDALVFPPDGDGSLSDGTLGAVIKRMNAEHAKPIWVDPKQDNRPVVPHGFRSCFRDWVGERSAFPNEMVEMALAHTIGNKVEAAYRRGDMLDKRRAMMEAWARFCEARTVPTRNVHAIGEFRT